MPDLDPILLAAQALGADKLPCCEYVWRTLMSAYKLGPEHAEGTDTWRAANVWDKDRPWSSTDAPAWAGIGNVHTEGYASPPFPGQWYVLQLWTSLTGGSSSVGPVDSGHTVLYQAVSSSRGRVLQSDIKSGPRWCGNDRPATWEADGGITTGWQELQARWPLIRRVALSPLTGVPASAPAGVTSASPSRVSSPSRRGGRRRYAPVTERLATALADRCDMAPMTADVMAVDLLDSVADIIEAVAWDETLPAPVGPLLELVDHPVAELIRHLDELLRKRTPEERSERARELRDKADALERKGKTKRAQRKRRRANRLRR